MTCRLPPAQVHHPVPAEQYNALLARCDDQARRCSHLESSLEAVREENAFLQRRIADLKASQPSSSQHQPSSHPAYPCPPQTHPYSQPSSAAESKDQTHMDMAPSSDKQENVLPAQDSKGHDKEILSHCSDISAYKSASRIPDVKKPASRKPSSNLTATGGVSKKSKSKKERQAKAKIPGQSRYWTPEEHQLFLEALNKYGHKNLRSISTYVGTRNMTQVRTHSQKYFMRLMREAKRQNPVGTKPASSGDEDGMASATAGDEGSRAGSVKGTATSGGRGENSKAGGGGAVANGKEADSEDKYSVPNTCGMTLLCLVGEDTLAAKTS